MRIRNIWLIWAMTLLILISYSNALTYRSEYTNGTYLTGANTENEFIGVNVTAKQNGTIINFTCYNGNTLKPQFGRMYHNNKSIIGTWTLDASYSAYPNFNIIAGEKYLIGCTKNNTGGSTNWGGYVNVNLVNPYNTGILNWTRGFYVNGGTQDEYQRGVTVIGLTNGTAETLSFITTPINNTHNNTLINVTMNCSQAAINYSLYYEFEGANYTLSEAIADNFTLLEGEWNNGVYKFFSSCCSASGCSVNSTPITWIYDTEIPDISENLLDSYDDTLFVNYTLTDTVGLYGYELRLCNVLDIDDCIYNESNIALNGVTEYVLYLEIPLGGASGTYYLNITVADTHTANKIDDYIITKSSDTIIFNTAEDNVISIKAEGSISSDTIKTADRYELSYTYDKPTTTKKFVIEDVTRSKTITYYPDSKFNGHFVIFDKDTFTGNWIDFEGISGDISVVMNDKFSYTVEFKNNLDDFVGIKSIGGLNYNTLVYPLSLNGNITGCSFLFDEYYDIQQDLTCETLIGLEGIYLNFCEAVQICLSSAVSVESIVINGNNHSISNGDYSITGITNTAQEFTVYNIRFDNICTGISCSNGVLYAFNNTFTDISCLTTGIVTDGCTGSIHDNRFLSNDTSSLSIISSNFDVYNNYIRGLSIFIGCYYDGETPVYSTFYNNTILLDNAVYEDAGSYIIPDDCVYFDNESLGNSYNLMDNTGYSQLCTADIFNICDPLCIYYDGEECLYYDNYPQGIFGCASEWVQNAAPCISNLQFISYYDSNTCDTPTDLPANNNTYIACLTPPTVIEIGDDTFIHILFILIIAVLLILGIIITEWLISLAGVVLIFYALAVLYDIDSTIGLFASIIAVILILLGFFIYKIKH